MKEQLTFVIDKDKADKLRKMADEKDRPLASMIRVLLEKAIKVEELRS